MRSRRRQRQRAKSPQPETREAWEVWLDRDATARTTVMPGYEAEQERAQRELDGDAWYEDPSYAERVMEREWHELGEEYLAWLNKA